MRVKSTKGPLRALAVAGTRVVSLGWDMQQSDIRSRKVLGFAIERTRERDGEVVWMRGLKTFKSVLENPGQGVSVSTRDHPFQSFQWADYSVQSDEGYTYKVVARVGEPGNLKDGPSATLRVKTESERVGRHSVFFNRGAVASQEYARRFKGNPEQVGKAAWDWLSRGLIEALEAFIGQAGSGDELHGAIFEFKHERVYAALKAAKQRGAKVFILYDGKEQGKGNEKALRDHKVSAWLKPKSQLRPRRRSGRYAHNKFLVLSRQGTPEQVWTGSTNLSINGIFGHSNNAHVVRDRKVARIYKAYWDRLWTDPTKRSLAAANWEATPAPPANWSDETVAIFSPHQKAEALAWYVKLSAEKGKPLFTTFAFGMNALFVPVYEQRDGVLRFALMEKKGNGKLIKEQAKVIDRIRRLPNTVVAVGSTVDRNNTFDRWLVERVKIVNEAHVLFVHTKYMLIDPLGENPIVIVGSANFSKASSDTNDENMLVIRGNQAVADIYLGEFMRLHQHYAYRESLGFRRDSEAAYGRRRKHLVESVEWIKGESPGTGYYDKGSARALRRSYFAGG